MRTQLDVGAALREVFALYRDKAGLLLPLAFLLFLISAVANVLAPTGFGFFVLPLILGILIATLYQGMVVSLVRDLRDDRRDSSVRELASSVWPVLWELVGAGILAGLGIVFGFLLLVVPGLYLTTIWAVIAPVIVVERLEVLEAFGRSRHLVRGNGWRVFAVVILAGLISFVVGFIFLLLAREIADNPVLAIASSALASTITAPIEALVASVLYFRLLMLQQPSDGLG